MSGGLHGDRHFTQGTEQGEDPLISGLRPRAAAPAKAVFIRDTCDVAAAGDGDSSVVKTSTRDRRGRDTGGVSVAGAGRNTSCVAPGVVARRIRMPWCYPSLVRSVVDRLMSSR